ERLCQLHALARALAVGTDALAGLGRQPDAIERDGGCLARFLLAESVESHERRHPLGTRHPLVEGILFRTEADTPVEARIGPHRFPQYAQRSGVRLELPGDE